jgi:hypothetical protein
MREYLETRTDRSDTYLYLVVCSSLLDICCQAINGRIDEHVNNPPIKYSLFMVFFPGKKQVDHDLGPETGGIGAS